MQIDNKITVKPKWDIFDYPIRRGTPISMTGQLANDGNAVGITMETISTRPFHVDYLAIMTGGSVNMTEVDYPSLSTAAMRAMNGIRFFGADGTPAADPLYTQYTLPTASSNTLGGVKIGSGFEMTGGKLSVKAAATNAIGGVKMAANVEAAVGDAPTAAEFKALLDALKAAGIMAPDAAED